MSLLFSFPQPAAHHLDNPAPWALEMCLGCTRYASLEVHHLACCCSCGQCRHLRLFALAWICHHCNYVLESVGLYTYRWAALDARRRTLEDRQVNGTSRWRGTRSSP